MEWLQFEIPEKFIGNTQVIGNEYMKTYRTEILLPNNGEYAGYCFLFPEKLISLCGKFAKLTYNESFTFTLTKRDREPGKRYKRYTLTISELLAIYEPEVLKLRAQLAAKEKRRLAQVGDVIALECRSYNRYYVKFIFQFGKKMFTGKGTKFPYMDEIHQSRIVATNISREQFESTAQKLDALCEEYQVIQDVRRSINYSYSIDSSDKAVAIYNSFYNLSDQWENEFYNMAYTILETTSSVKE
ncbi:MAG: hypothetical protein IJZ42_01740 [Lachnospiraceae bacterium]|nr:hypothetical protein [Lachnospiraceae bacterium]